MPVLVLATALQAGGNTPLPLVQSAIMCDIAPGASRAVPLAGRTALVFVQFGVLTVAGHNSPRALPGEWVRAAGMAGLEYANGSRTERLKVFEIVFGAEGEDERPAIEQRYFSDDDKADRLCLVASACNDSELIGLGCDARVYAAALGRWSTVLHDLRPGCGALLWVLAGDATVNNQKLESGAGAFITKEEEVRIAGGAGAEVVLLEAAAA